MSDTIGMSWALSYLVKEAVGRTAFRELVTRYRPLVARAKVQGGFTNSEAQQLNSGIQAFLRQRAARRGLNPAFIPARTGHDVAGIMSVPGAKSPLSFQTAFPSAGERPYLPFLSAEHVVYSGGRGSGAGSRMVRDLNHLYKALGFDMAKLTTSGGSEKLWSRPKFGFNAILGGPSLKSIRFSDPGELHGATMAKVFQPEVARALAKSKGRNPIVYPDKVMSSTPAWFKPL